MNQLPILVAAANLSKSPSNVRKSSDAVADAQLEANIAAKGIRQNLIGVPVARKKGHYRIAAGGRRLDAVHRLIEKGVFEPDYQVPVLVLRDAKDAIATSLEENFFKLSMNPADTCRAFQDIVETEGKTPAEIAKRFGLTERFVLGRLRLADLAPCIFDALRDGEISLEIAMAYASSPDAVRQAQIFETLGQSYYRNNLNEIRRQLAQGSYSGNDPKALLVGREAYVAAGGRIDSDLFTDDASEMWIDGDLLDQLATDRLAQAAQAIREREGFGDVRIVPTTHIAYSATWDLKPIEGEQWLKLQGDLDRCWINHADVRTRYDAFCALSQEARVAWFSWAIARTVQAVPAGRTGSVFLDHLGVKLGIDVTAWWRPTARNYFDRVSKAMILQAFETVGGLELSSRYVASKKHDLALSAERLFSGDLIVEAEVKDRALQWLPDAMRFVPVGDAEASLTGDGDADCGVGRVSVDGDAAAEALAEAPDEDSGEDRVVQAA